MKISDLAVFCTVVEAPSLTEAANKLHKNAASGLAINKKIRTIYGICAV